MSNSLIFAIVASVTIHFFVLFYSTRITLKEPPKSNPIAETKKDAVERIEVRLLPKEQALETSVITKNELSIIPKKSYPSDSRICSGKDKDYRGIGIIYNPITGLILHAPTYYPAYQAGLRVGDMILSPDTPYTDEAYTDIQYIRPNGDSIRQSILRIKIDNICFTEDK